MEWIWLAAVFAVAYLIGSISTAILVGKLFAGDDIRTHGSGNAGATNALRTYGKKAAALVVLGDCLKATAAILLALLAAKVTPLGAERRDLAVYAASFGAVLGHNFPIYFKFRGGKGVLVSMVAILFADWKIGLGVVVIALTVMALTRYVSLGSILAAVSLVILGCIFRWGDWGYILFTLLLAGLVIIMHRGNIVRLLHGEENKLGQKNKKAGCGPQKES